MSISRRDFFAEAFGKAAAHIHKVIPTGMHRLLETERDKPLSAEEAAFSLVKTKRKKSPLASSTDNRLQDNAHLEPTDKTEDK